MRNLSTHLPGIATALTVAVAITTCLAAFPVLAADAPEAAASAPASVAMTEGEVVKVDRTARTLMLKHGDIPNLDMPGMTMTFKVADPTLLTRVKPGDKLRFNADRINGALTVTGFQIAD